MNNSAIEDTHPVYDDHVHRWSFYLRSYMGGEDYKEGGYLTSYISEDKDEYARPYSDGQPLQKHCPHLF